jgi:hypothetical protein
MTILTPEHWAKIKENNEALRNMIEKIEISGITVEEYARKYPKLSKLINLEEVMKMKKVVQTISVPAKIGKKKAAAKADIIIAGNITPKDLAKELKTSAKVLRKVIRKLKLVRTGKCWQWAPNSAEINLIKNAYLKSLQPAVEKKTAHKKAAKVEVTMAEAMAEEEAEEVEEEVDEPEDITTIKVPPAI